MGLWDWFRRAPPLDPRVGPHSAAHAAQILDHLALLHPEAAPIEVWWQMANGSVRVDRMDWSGPPDQAPAALVDDPFVRVALLGSALRDLWLGLSLPQGSSAPVTAGRDTVAVAGLTIPVDPRQRIHGPDWLGWLREVGPTLAATQERVQAAMAAAGPLESWDREHGRLVFAGGSLRAHVLGSFAPSQDTWCWSWANGALASVEQAAIGRVRDAARLPILIRPGFPCTEPFAFQVAHTAAEQVAPGCGIWRWPQRAGAHLFFAVEA